jgi:hypothetical protein
MQQIRGLKASTHDALFGRSLEFSCFHVLLVAHYSRINFVLFLLKLCNLQKHDSMKTLNYGQKVHSVYSPLQVGFFTRECKKFQEKIKNMPGQRET